MSQGPLVQGEVARRMTKRFGQIFGKGRHGAALPRLVPIRSPRSAVNQVQGLM
jgi:hypothetical protein